MRRTVEMIPVATAESWTLFEHAKPNARWRTVKLVRTGPVRKHFWWLGWNGERLSRSRDADHLEQHHPEIARWVVECMRAADD
jgi:hypothetical protein